MTTLVTGGTGFIGAEIVKMLVARGDGPIVVTHRSGNFDRLAAVADDVEFVQLDLADADAIEEVLQQVAPQRLFHFAAVLTGPGELDPPSLLEANAVGFVRMIEGAVNVGVEQMIFASSIGSYGRDVGEGTIDASTPQRPATVYGVTKAFGENLGAYYRQRYGLDFRGIRYPSIVGPGVTTRSVAQYTSWMIEYPLRGEPFEVWADEDSTVPILYYLDAARAAVDLADAPTEAIASINYLVNGPSPAPSAGAIAATVRASMPAADITFAVEPEQSFRMQIDDARARREWDWHHEYELVDMIADMTQRLGG